MGGIIFSLERRSKCGSTAAQYQANQGRPPKGLFKPISNRPVDFKRPGGLYALASNNLGRAYPILIGLGAAPNRAWADQFAGRAYCLRACRIWQDRRFLLCGLGWRCARFPPCQPNHLSRRTRPGPVEQRPRKLCPTTGARTTRGQGVSKNSRARGCARTLGWTTRSVDQKVAR